MGSSKKKLKEHHNEGCLAASRCHDNAGTVVIIHFVYKLESPVAITIAHMSNWLEL